MKLIMNMQMILIMSLSLINMIINLIPSYNKNIHPIIMSLLLMMLCLFTSMNLSIYMNNQWFSFIMFLIIISGLMILFLYFTSFISNMIMTIKLNLMMMIPIKLILMIMMTTLMMMKYKINLTWYNNFNEINKMNMMIKLNLLNENMKIMYMYMYNKNISTLICMIYLFICLTMIVKMCIFKKYSMRKIN